MEKKILIFLEKLSKDKRISVWHLALIIGILQLSYKQNQDREVKINRRELMKISCINTFPTYHKYLKELQKYGYVIYIPSYHPKSRSVIDLIF